MSAHVYYTSAHLNPQTNFDLFRTCRTSSFCTVAWQLARFQLTRSIVRSLGDSGASFYIYLRRAGPYTLPCQMSSTTAETSRFTGLHNHRRRLLETSIREQSTYLFVFFFRIYLPSCPFPSLISSLFTSSFSFPSIPAFPALHSLCHSTSLSPFSFSRSLPFLFPLLSLSSP